MAHVGVQRLRARDGQHDRAESPEDAEPAVEDEVDAVDRIERQQHAGMFGELPGAQHAQHREPQQHDGSEHPADPFGAARLQHEQPDQDGERQRHHVAGQARRHGVETLDGAHDRHRRRDDRVAVEQREARHREQGDGVADPPAAAVQALGRQRRQRHHAAFALVVGPHDQGNVLDRHREGDRPEQDRQHAQHMARRRRHARTVGEGLAQRIERAGADIAEHHAQRSHDHRRHGRFHGRGGQYGSVEQWCRAAVVRSHDMKSPRSRRRRGFAPALPACQRAKSLCVARKWLDWGPLRRRA